MESASAGFDFSHFCGDFFAPGPADDDSTSRRPETQPAADADRRRRPACEMVFRLEAESDRVATHRKAAGAPDGGSGHTPLAKLRARRLGRDRDSSNAALDVGKVEPHFDAAEV